MIAASLITAALNEFYFAAYFMDTILRLIAKCEPCKMRTHAIVLALKPLERWEAAGRFSSNFMTERWFILMGVIAIIILTAALFAVSLHRTLSGRKVSKQLFTEYANKRGLSARERQILLAIANNAGLKESEAIFTMGGAFDRGAAKMIEKSLAQGGAEAGEQLKVEMSFLREKLGLHKQRLSSIGSMTRPKKLSSRQIPAGKKVHINRRTNRTSDDIESTIIENNDMELKVKLETPVKITFGEFWRVRYYFGASVWEFDTSVISYDGDVLVLNHSDDVRFINRRRFLRVPVRMPAFIARFPFVTALPPNNDSNKTGSKVGRDLADASVGTWRLPEFVPAVITELAGPGLRIETSLEIKVGNRVLVVFRLDEENEEGSIAARRDDKTPTSKIIEDIGEVRHTKAAQNGLSIAVELVGLSDSNVNELIRATNAASVKADAKGQETGGLVNTKRDIPASAVEQGV